MSIAPIGLVALAGIALAVAEWRRRLFRRRREHEALRVWHEAAELRRESAMDGLLRTAPASATAWYLAGCAACRRRDYATAARRFGMAHHRDAELISAAMLTFACLKSAARRTESPVAWLGELVRTWQEMQAPRLAAGAWERALWRELAVGLPPAPALSDLGLLAWLVGGPTDQEELLRLSAFSEPWARPLLSDSSDGRPTDN